MTKTNDKLTTAKNLIVETLKGAATDPERTHYNRAMSPKSIGYAINGYGATKAADQKVTTHYLRKALEELEAEGVIENTSRRWRGSSWRWVTPERAAKIAEWEAESERCRKLEELLESMGATEADVSPGRVQLSKRHLVELLQAAGPDFRFSPNADDEDA